MTSSQKQFIVNWHNTFVDYVKKVISLTDTMKLLDKVTDNDKRNLELFKNILHCKDVQEIERDLANAKIKKSTLNKIEKLDKDIVDFVVEHMSVSPTFRHILKQVSYYQIEYNKQMAIMQLNDLQIPMCEE